MRSVAETDGFDDRRCARLEFMRRIAIGYPVHCDFADHFAAAIVGPHRHEMFVLGIEHADAGRPVKLVPGKDVEVAIERGDIDRQSRYRLTPVEQRLRAHAMREIGGAPRIEEGKSP